MLLARFAVPVIAKRCQGITLAFKVTAGDVIQKQCRLTGPAPRCEQAALDGRLMVSQPRQVVIEIILIKTARQLQHLTGRVRLGEAHRRQPRALINDPGDDLPQRQLAGEIRAQRRFDPQAARGVVKDPDGAYRAAFLQLGGVCESTQNGEVVLVLQSQADRCHFLGCAVGEVRNGPIFDLASLAVGLTQEDTAVGSAIGSNARRLGDIHNYDNKAIFPQMLGEPEKSSDYKSSSKRAANSRGSPHLCHSLWGEHTIKHIAHACFPIGHEDGIGLWYERDPLRLVESSDGMQMYPCLQVEDLQRIVAQCGDEQSLALEVAA